MGQISNFLRAFICVIIGFCLINSTIPLHSQWVYLSDHHVNSFAISGSILFAGSDGSGAFRSTNNGINWIQINTGLPSDVDVNIIFFSGNLFAGTAEHGIFRSTNNGTSWTEVNNGLPKNSRYVSAFTFSGPNLFVGTRGVFLSTNNGTSWTAVNTGLPPNVGVSSLTISGTNLFAGIVANGVFFSTNNGTNWAGANNGLPTNYDVINFAVSGTNLFTSLRIFVGGGVFLSSNSGTSWTAVNNGLTYNYVESFAVSGTNIFAGASRDGVFRSTNNGTNWTAINDGLPNPSRVVALVIYGANLFAGNSTSGVWRRPLSEIISVQNISTEVPEHFRLEQNYPNPFNPVTNIEFSIPKQGNAKIIVYDSQGKEVASLLDQSLTAGTYKVDFDGTNFSSGIYFYRLETEGFVQTKSMVLLK